jgi:hypothetical protein
MLAVSIKDPGDVDFVLNNSKKFVTKVKEHLENGTILRRK